MDEWSTVGGPNSPTQSISGLLVKLYIKDTNISHDMGLKALSYWTDKKWNSIPEHFTKTSTLEAASFVLLNNSFQFDIYIFTISWYCNGYEFGPLYACFSVGYLEEIILFPKLLPFYFTLIECKLIQETFKNVLWMMILFYGQKNAKIVVFWELLNELHSSLKFTVGKGKISCERNLDTFAKVSNVLDVCIILQQNSRLETDLFCKETKWHYHLNYFSHYREHTKQNTP